LCYVDWLVLVVFHVGSPNLLVDARLAARVKQGR
jgi:hypothetical protein